MYACIYAFTEKYRSSGMHVCIHVSACVLVICVLCARSVFRRLHVWGTHQRRVQPATLVIGAARARQIIIEYSKRARNAPTRVCMLAEGVCF